MHELSTDKIQVVSPITQGILESSEKSITICTPGSYCIKQSDSEEKIYASTPNGRQFKLDDQNGLIQVSDGTNNMHMDSSATHIWRGENHISMTDQSIHSWNGDYHVLVDKGQVKLYSGNNMIQLGPKSISIKHGSKVELSADGSTITLTPGSVQINGKAVNIKGDTVDIKGAPIKLNC